MSNDSYSGTSSIYAGMQAPPSWAQGLALYQWTQVPGNTLSSINPENNPVINPNHPNASPWRGNTGQRSLIDGYSGAAYDDSTGEWWMPIQGGHGDYGGNEPYKAQIFAESVQWQMIRNPSGAIGNVINLNDGQENTGLYSDGRLRAVHSYSNNAAANGKVYALILNGQFPTGSSAKAWVVEINKSTGEHTLICDYSATATTIYNGYGGGAIDSTRNAAFVTGRGFTRITRIDLNTGTAIAVTPANNIFEQNATYPTAVYAENVDRIIFVAPQSAASYLAKRGLAVVNPANNSVSYPQCEDFPAFVGKAPAAVWQPSQNRLLLWDNDTETNKLAVLTPSNPADLSQPWTASVITGTGVTPSVRCSVGTYNRMQYSKRLGGVLLLNATNQQFYFMRTD